MKKAYILNKIWVESTDEKGEKVIITVENRATRNRVIEIFNKLGISIPYWTTFKKERCYEVRSISDLELLTDARLGEFKYNIHIAAKQITTP